MQFILSDASQVMDIVGVQPLPLLELHVKKYLDPCGDESSAQQRENRSFLAGSYIYLARLHSTSFWREGYRGGYLVFRHKENQKIEGWQKHCRQVRPSP